MLKRLISLSLLCVAGHTYAGNIFVNTTEDDNANNDKCSLREAIALVNLKGADGKIPEQGYQGCDGKDATSIVVLESGQTYKVNKEIPITKSVSIISLPPVTESTLSYKGEKNAIVKAMGKHRLFKIEKASGDNSASSLNTVIEEVDLVGCGANGGTQVCDISGGIIYNFERLTINYSRITDGYANEGGAIFNNGIGDIAGSINEVAGFLTLSNVYFAKNRANLQGAAIYSSQPRYNITSSVFKENKVAGSLQDAAVVYVQNPVTVPPKDDITSLGSRTAQIFNSIFFKNDAYALNLRDAMVVGNSTIVRNRGGVYLNAKSGAANLSNSIVAENNTVDCKVDPVTNKAVTNNLVFNKGDCNINASSANPNIQLDATNPLNRLFANSKIGAKDPSVIEGECDKAGLNGLLCPFSTEKEVFNGYFKPRLLVAYKKLSDSPIVNRGRVSGDGSTTNTFSCSPTDQRGKPRDLKLECDIGSIELTVGEPTLVGQDLRYGQIAELNLKDNLGDGELWPASSCESELGKRSDSTPWQEGCLDFEDESKKPTKGNLLLSADALLKYTPLRNFHGSDNFTFRIMTTTTRFSTGNAEKTIAIDGRIVMDPPDTFQNKTAGGGMGIVSLFGLLGLAWIRRRLQGV